MIDAATKDYGSLTGLVQTAGIIVSAGIALSATWRRRARWEPSEQDIPKGAERVGGLLTAVITTLLWTGFSSQTAVPTLQKVAIWAVGLTVMFLLIYGYLVSVQTYDVDLSTATETRSKKIIGGFWLQPAAKKVVRKGKTVQEALAGSAYVVDKIWPRSAVALAHQAFIVGYIGLTVFGTVALTAAAMLLLLFQQRPAGG